MRLPEHIVLGFIGLVALVTACGQPYVDEPLPPGVEEIPVTTKSGDALARFRRGQKLLDIGRNLQANPVFENATGKDPRFSWAYLNAAITAASAREFNDYLKLAAMFLEDKSEGERLLVEIAQTYKDNDPEKRVALVETLVETYPRSRRAWLALAEVRTGLFQYPAAREALAEALELDPNFMATNMALFRTYLFNQPKDLARAEQAMLKCLEIAPGEGSLYEQLADVNRAMNKLEKARDLYGQAAEKDPELAVASIKKAHINAYLGQYDEARADYDVGIEGARDQSRFEYANYRAFTNLHAGDFAAALDELATVLTRIDEAGLPRDQIVGVKVFTLTSLVATQLHHGLLDEAEASLADLAEAHRSVAEQAGAAHIAREREAAIVRWEGRLAARRGDYELAVSKAEEHLRLAEDSNDPRYEQGHQHLLGLVELLQGNHEQAVEHLRQTELRDIYVKYQLARAEEGAGNVEEAKRLFEEVATSNFNNIGFALVRGEALERMI